MLTEGGTLYKKAVFAMLVIFSTFAWSALAQEQAPGPFTEVQTAICAQVIDREPQGTAETFAAGIEQVYLWTKFVGAADSTTVSHVWLHNGNEMATVELPVRSSSWRTWSSKKMLPSWVGDWEVKVLDSEGNILKSVTFTIEEAVAPEAGPAEAAEPEAEPAETAEPETAPETPVETEQPADTT